MEEFHAFALVRNCTMSVAGRPDTRPPRLDASPRRRLCALDEVQNVGVELVRVGRRKAVAAAWVDFHDLIVVAACD